MARRFEARAETAGEHARVLEKLIRRPVPLPLSADDDGEDGEDDQASGTG